MRALFLLALSAPALAQPAPEQVTMTLDQFLQLYEQSKTRPPRPEDAPRHFSLDSARYDGRVVLEDGEPISAVFTARFRVENLRGADGWIRAPLLPASVAVRSARVGGAEAPIALENGWYTLVTDRQGAFDVVVELAVSVGTNEGSSGFEFALAPSGATELELTVPASDALDFTVANAQLVTDRKAGNQRTVTATLPATGSLSVRWQREIPEVEQQAARVYSEVHTLVGVGDGLLTAHATLQQAILFDGVDTFRAQIPKDMTVLGVEGSGLRDWSVGEDGVLTAQLNFAAEGAYTLMLDLERVLPAGSQTVEVPLVVPLDVERSKGFVGVQALGNLELDAGTYANAAPVDVRTLPADIVGITGQPVLLGFKYLGDQTVVPLEISEHDEVDVLVTLLDQAEATTMFTHEGRRLSSVRYQVRNNRRQFLRLVMPEGSELWSASVAGRSVQPARSADGDILVPLVRSQAQGGALAAFEVEVVYVESGTPPVDGRGRFEGALPTADAPTTWVGWTVYVPKGAKVARNSKKYDGTLQKVEGLSRPATAAQVYQVPAQGYDLNQVASGMAAAGGFDQGAAPVEVTLPVDGQPIFFEKLLALDERLAVGFDYKGLK